MPPKNIEQEIQARVAAFAADLGALIRQSVMDSLSQALGAAPAAKAAAPAAAAPAAPAKAGRGKGKGKRGRGAKGAAGTGPVAAAIVDYVAANSGSRLEQISKGLGKPSAGLKPAVAALLASGALRKEGQKRGTQYFTGKGGGAPVAAAAAEAGEAAPKRGRFQKRGGKKAGAKRMTKKK